MRIFGHPIPARMPLVSRAAVAGLLALGAPAVLAQTLSAAAPDSLASTVLPVRSVREVASLGPAFRRDLATGTLVFRSRTGGLVPVQEPVFVVDGVRRLGGPLGASTLSLLGAQTVPFAAARRVDALGGFVPAPFGEAGGGIVRVTTDDSGERVGGRLEGLSSEISDAYGARLASATLRGPLGSRAGFSVTGEARRMSDAVPSSVRSLRLTDDAYARFDATPQTITVRDAAGVRTVAVPVFSGGRPYTEADLRAALGLGPDATIDPQSLRTAADGVTEADLERVRAQDDPVSDLALTGQAVAFLSSTGRLRAGGSLFRRTMSATAPTPAEAYSRRFSNRDGLSRQTSDRAGVFVAAERVALPGGIAASARASFETTGSLLRPAAFSDDVSDALRYGDADDDVFGAAQRYVTTNGQGLFFPQNTGDGTSGPSVRPFTGFVLPGAGASLYDRQSATSTQAAAGLERAFGAHRLSVGGEVEAQTFRRFTLDGLGLASYASDGNGLPIPAQFGPDGTTVTQPALPNGVDRYGQLTFDALRVPTLVRYGYDALGLAETDDESVTGYFPNAAGVRANTNVAPFRPLTTAGYVRDQFQIGPVAIDAGLRLERYDARATTLFDPFSTVPIQRAGDLPSAPAGIGSDFAVYYASGGSTLVGFRDRDGQFYDAAGAAATPDAILNDARGSVFQLSTGTVEDLFAPTRAVTRLQPRVGVRVQASRAVVVTGYAMRASRRPDPSLYVSISAYDQLSQQTALGGNAALRPEDVRAAGLDVEVAAAPGVVLGVAGFGRQTRDVAEPAAFVGGFPQYGGVRGHRRPRRGGPGPHRTPRARPRRGVGRGLHARPRQLRLGERTRRPVQSLRHVRAVSRRHAPRARPRRRGADTPLGGPARRLRCGPRGAGAERPAVHGAPAEPPVLGLRPVHAGHRGRGRRRAPAVDGSGGRAPRAPRRARRRRRHGVRVGRERARRVQHPGALPRDAPDGCRRLRGDVRRPAGARHAGPAAALRGLHRWPRQRRPAAEHRGAVRLRPAAAGPPRPRARPVTRRGGSC